MTDTLTAPRPGLDLPPAFTPIALADTTDAFAHAREVAAEAGAGTLVWSQGADLLQIAVVLEPEEPLRTARRAFVIGMEALAVALGRTAPPEKPLTVEWPDTLRFDGARIGGGRLAWPAVCREEERPRWLVFGGTLIVSTAWAGEPGSTPDTTSLVEEGFDPAETPRLVEAFARHLLWAFDRWAAHGFDAVAADTLARIPRRDGIRVRSLDEAGDLLFDAGGSPGRSPLLPALLSPSWLDPATGTPRL